MNSQPIVKEISINAPASRIWKAITTKEEIKQWSFDIAEFEPIPGYEFRFNGGNEERQFLHICVVKEVIENKKLSYSWSYDDLPGIETLVTIELFEQSPHTTLVRLTHEGVDQFPQDKNFARGNFEMGWTEITKLLKKHVEQ
jgi:uncharacterized protein YndB with AHSA1/START domain